MLLLLLMRFINVRYETSMALVTFSFGSVFGIVMVRMPSSTLAEILSFTTSSGNNASFPPIHYLLVEKIVDYHRRLAMTGAHGVVVADVW